MKKRKSIPNDIAAEVLYMADRTCCVCQELGKYVQIHHIDENPENNSLDNLVPLCLHCHNQTQIKGGFGRHLGATLVRKYRDEWLQIVKRRRDKAVEIALEYKISKERGSKVYKSASCSRKLEPSLSYINSLPEFKRELTALAKPEWDSGVTARMVEANYAYKDALVAVLIFLSNSYSPDQFGGQTAEEFFSDVITTRYRWHRAVAEPQGGGTGGTIMNVLCTGAVLEDVIKMVEDMVMALVQYDDSFDWKGWPEAWRNA